MTVSQLVKRCLLVGALACSMSVTAADEATQSLTLSFNRTGDDVTSVTVNTAGIDGVTATLTAATPTPFKTVNNCNTSALCPDVNANANPTIVYEFAITGLPSDFTFNQIGLKTHAFNGNGDNQNADGAALRYYNVAIEANNSEFAEKKNQDLAKDNVGGHLTWDVTASEAFTATSPMTLRLTVTKGDTNGGCFFGLEEVTLKTAEETPEPVVTPPALDQPEGKTYTITWKNEGNLFMAQTLGGTIQALPSSTKNMQYWEFIPTDKTNCYYIRNLASGKYIGSCNFPHSSESIIKVSETPVEYYVGQTSADAAAIAGCFWLSSTDCENYDNETNSARALNKDGASSNVITWLNGKDKVGSYWKINEAENLFDLQPFTPSDEVGTPKALYHLVNAEGKSYTAEGAWEEFIEAENHHWYFVGTSNEDGGYQIVSAKDHKALGNGAKHTVSTGSIDLFYQFTNGETPLTLSGSNEFKIVTIRSAFALKNQIYNMPCGSISNQFITKVSIGDEFHYPMAQVSDSKITYPEASKPNNKYVILSKDAATVVKGSETPMSVTLNVAPKASTTITLFIDWNRDGVFEYSQALDAAKDITTAITVPATAETGVTRARIRLTDNGTTGAEEEVHGEVLDLRLNIVDASEKTIDPVVKVNDRTRGKAKWANGVATATPKGTALFLYWKENKRVVSVSATHEVEASATPRELTAVFSINTDPDNGDDDDDENKGNEEDALAQIELASGSIDVNGKVLSVNSEFEVKRILVFALNGTLAASAYSTTETTLSLPAGIYIAKAITAGGTITAKIQL